MNVKSSLTATVILTSLLVASAAIAQENRVAVEPTLCPHPVTLVINAPPPSPPTPDPLDFTGPLAAAVAGSVWNQTAVNKSFGHTFHFPSPRDGKCCVMTSGTLQVKVKCLQTGNSTSSTSGNDDINIVGVPASSRRIWPQPAGCKVGDVTTIPFPSIPAATLATGRVSFFVEDDTAVISATLTLHGCCINPQP